MTTSGPAIQDSREPAPRRPLEPRSTRLRLADLLAPIDAEAFHDRYWSRGVRFLSAPNAALVRKVKSVAAIENIDALLEHRTRDVATFGPGPVRGKVPAKEARAALDRGCNLYLTQVEESVPEVLDLFKGIAADLGAAPWQVTVEAFAGRAGGLSSRHYDHDINFQILLDGEKVWQLEPNLHIENPMQPFHPTQDANGRWTGFSEEGYASDPRMPLAFDPERSHEVTAVAGTALYLPRGVWHEVRSVTDTWGLNVVIKGVTWAEALTRALTARLHEDPRFRAYCEGYRGRTLCDAHGAARAKTFAALKEELVATLSELSLVDVELSPMGDRICGWVAEADAREVVCQDGSWLLAAPGLLETPIPLSAEAARIAAKLCSFRYPFRFKHARAALPDVSPEATYNLIALLAQKKLVFVRGPNDRP